MCHDARGVVVKQHRRYGGGGHRASGARKVDDADDVELGVDLIAINLGSAGLGIRVCLQGYSAEPDRRD
jgi:hypothetical protein